MFDVPEVVIIVLVAVTAAVWTHSWMSGPVPQEEPESLELFEELDEQAA